MRKKVRREGLTSVQIRPQIMRLMEKLTRRGVSKSEIINEALRQYLIEKELQEMRNELLPYGQAKGIYTDADVDRLFR